VPGRHHLITMSTPARNGSAAAGPPGPRTWWRGLSASRRRTLKIFLAAALVVVAVVGVLLARFLSVENAERDADLAVLEAQARGDARAMLDRLQGCARSAACLATVRADVANPRLRRRGAVKILSLESATAYSTGSATGRSRIAWTVIGTLPVVQCIDVHRSGNVITGMHVHLLSISAPIPNEGDC
jgi:hypothetical protein